MERPEPRLSALTCYYRHKPGGLCKRLTRAMDALAERGVEVHYIAATPFPTRHARCHYHRFPWPSSRVDSGIFWLVFFIVTPIFALYLARKHAINRLFAFEPTYAFLMQPTRWLFKLPLTVFFRADSIENYRIKQRPHLFIRLAQWIEGRGIKRASVFAVSQHCLDNIVRRHHLGPVARVGLLRNDLPPLDVIPRRVIGTDPIRLSCAGVLEDRKNQQFLIRLMSRLPKNTYHLSIYGEGPRDNDLKALATRLNVIECVDFHGWTEITRILQRTDLLLAPSLHEGAPNILLEALSAEVPFIASDIDEHREIFPIEALLPLYESEWLDKLISIRSEPGLLNEMNQQLQETRQRLLFDWDQAFFDVVNNSPVNTAAATP